MIQGRLDDAQAIWEENLERATPIERDSYHIINRLWLATVLQERGELAAAYQLAEGVLNDAERVGYTRAVVTAQLRLAALDLALGRLDSLAARLRVGAAIATPYQDRPNVARIRYLEGRLAMLRGESENARVALLEAVDHYERLGLSRELAEAQQALAVLTVGRQRPASP